jgi:hypothetical protein
MLDNIILGKNASMDDEPEESGDFWPGFHIPDFHPDGVH